MGSRGTGAGALLGDGEWGGCGCAGCAQPDVLRQFAAPVPSQHHPYNAEKRSDIWNYFPLSQSLMPQAGHLDKFVHFMTWKKKRQTQSAVV